MQFSLLETQVFEPGTVDFASLLGKRTFVQGCPMYSLLALQAMPLSLIQFDAHVGELVGTVVGAAVSATVGVAVGVCVGDGVGFGSLHVTMPQFGKLRHLAMQAVCVLR
jgi:hypothetical protein